MSIQTADGSHRDLLAHGLDPAGVAVEPLDHAGILPGTDHRAGLRYP